MFNSILKANLSPTSSKTLCLRSWGCSSPSWQYEHKHISLWGSNEMLWQQTTLQLFICMCLAAQPLDTDPERMRKRGRIVSCEYPVWQLSILNLRVVRWGVPLNTSLSTSSCADVLICASAHADQTVVFYINSHNSLLLLRHAPTCTPQCHVVNSALALGNEAAFLNTPDVDTNIYRCRSLPLAYCPQLEVF